MRTSRCLFGLTLLMIVIGVVACRGRTEQEVAETPAVTTDTPEATASEAPAAVQEQSVEAHGSTTHGALQVRSIQENPTDWFTVLQDGKNVLPGNPELLNKTVELPPGTYEVVVNQTQRTVTIETGKKTTLWTGELIVEGGPDGAFWYPMEGTERRLTSNPPIVNASVDLFPGTYTVFVHVIVGQPDDNLGTAEVRAGQRTALRH
jgi:hypothetical protein